MNPTNSPSLPAGIAATFIDDVFRLWIAPELQRRKESGAENLSIADVTMALIIFGSGGSIDVRLNQEAGMIARAIAARDLVAGQEMTLEDAHDIVWVEPLRSNGRPAAYILVFLRPRPSFVFNFKPNIEPVSEEEWRMEAKKLAQFLSVVTFEGSLGPLEPANRALLPYRWWVMQSSIPQPLRTAVQFSGRRCSQQEMDELFVRHFSWERLQKLTRDWEGLPEFQSRSRIIRESLENYREGKFAFSIVALLPQIEGVLNSWLRQRRAAAPQGMANRPKVLANF